MVENPKLNAEQAGKVELEAKHEAKQNAQKKANAQKEKTSGISPVTPPSTDQIEDKDPAVKDLSGYEKYASNDGTFVLSKLDDKTSVAPGNVMENQAREPAHQQHELAIEEDSPGFESAAGLMTARGNPFYDGRPEDGESAARETNEASSMDSEIGVEKK